MANTMSVSSTLTTVAQNALRPNAGRRLWRRPPPSGVSLRVPKCGRPDTAGSRRRPASPRPSRMSRRRAASRSSGRRTRRGCRSAAPSAARAFGRPSTSTASTIALSALSSASSATSSPIGHEIGRLTTGVSMPRHTCSIRVDTTRINAYTCDRRKFCECTPPWRSTRTSIFISVAARMLGMHPQTLRKYERLGLVQPTRTIGSMRVVLARRARAAEAHQAPGRRRRHQPRRACSACCRSRRSCSASGR